MQNGHPLIRTTAITARLIKTPRIPFCTINARLPSQNRTNIRVEKLAAKSKMGFSQSAWMKTPMPLITNAMAARVKRMPVVFRIAAGLKK